LGDKKLSIKIYNKLVRDKIPEIITADGEVPVTRVLDQNEYREALYVKLDEELEELRTASEIERISELADLQEVLDALACSYGYSPSGVRAAAADKRSKRGGFARKIYLEHTLKPE
jgi:predicted house-cleaning noncanonical NTP pyrophosphatase (MazG superfamily)